jgi:hypothetical protein
MATTTIYIGDTITFRSEFLNAAGEPGDPDGSAATFTVYNYETLSVVDTGAATRESAGVYVYNWLVPEGDGVRYILEMKGDFDGLPQLERTRAKARFRPLP